MNIEIKISEQELSIDECFSFINDIRYGGNCLFVGTVRNHSNNEDITHLDFESYRPMAIKELSKIAQVVEEKYQDIKIYISHFVGHAPLGTKVVIIGVATKHRKASFEACAYIIDTLKETVPIWKKEFLENGSYWVNARP